MRKYLVLIMSWGFFLWSMPADVHSQDVFSEIRQLRDQITALQNEVENLKAIVYAREKQPSDAKESIKRDAPPASAPVPKQLSDEEKKNLKNQICKAGDEFLAEVDAVLGINNEAAAEQRMDRATSALSKQFRQYADIKEVSRFLSLANDLGWDAYTAVGLRESIEGNSEFLKYIENSKRKFQIFCKGNPSSQK
jgi:hypothetical protein